MSAPRQSRRRKAKAVAEFNPSALVQLVIDSLYDRHGISVPAESANVVTAVDAAADLLRALHIESTAAPRL